MLVLNMLNTPYHRSTPGKVATTTKKQVLKVIYVAKNSKGILVKGLGNVLFYSSSITNVHVLGFVNTQKLRCSKGILVKCFGVCLLGFVNTLSTFSISLLTWYQSGDLPMSLPPPFPTKLAAILIDTTQNMTPEPGRLDYQPLMRLFVVSDQSIPVIIDSHCRC